MAMGALIIAGWGQLYAEFVRLFPQGRPASEAIQTGPGDCLIFVADAPDFEALSQWQEHCRKSKATLVPIYLDGNELVAGPWVSPAEPGCATCAALRRRAVHPHKERIPYEEQAVGWWKDRKAENPRLSPFAVEAAGALLQESLTAWNRQAQPPLLHRLVFLPLDTLCVSTHPFLPVPTCPVCATLPEDTREAVVAPVQPRPKRARTNFRVPEQSWDLPDLRKRFVDRRVGVIANEIRLYNNDWLALSAAELALDFRSQREPGIGRTLSFADSDFTGVLEALERYGGMRPLGKRTAVRGVYRELQADAVDPASFLLHSPWQYEVAGFPFVRYHPDLPIGWVWGYSFRQNRAVLVPEQLAYYRLKDLTREQNTDMFAYEISNGCALGGSLEEAVLHGLFEVAERDGFLLTWYGQLPAPRLDLEAVDDPEVRFLLDRMEMYGFAVHAFNITYDFGIPSVWVMAVNQRDSGIRSFSAAGAHLDPLRALKSGLVELVAGAFDFTRIYPEHRERILPMVQKPELVRSMQDHALLYTLPETFDRLQFLLGGSRSQTLEEAFPQWYEVGPEADLTQDLSNCVARVVESGCDLIVVDQTPPEQAHLGIRTVKVLVPGALPMTFGHLLRRVEGAARLQQVPKRFGYGSREGLVNPHPHPFP